MKKPIHIGPGLDLPADSVTQTYAIIAKRGVGKTSTAVRMAEEMIRADLPVAIVDPTGVWWGLRSSADGKSPGLPVIILGGDHADVPLEVGGGAIVADFVIEARQPVVVDVSTFRKGEQLTFMTAFSERLYLKNREALHLILDEADAWAPQRPMHGAERLLGAIEDLIRRGRARGLGLTLITQRAAVLNKNCLTQIEVLVALRTIAPQDRAAIDDWIKVHGTPAQREEMMLSLPSLPIGTAWFWSPGWLDIFQRVAVAPRETFDSSATPKVGAKAHAPKALAEVDLAGLRNRMAETIERAKADNPKELRRRIAELEKQVAAKTPAPAAAKVERVEVPMLTAKDRASIDKLAASLDRIREPMDGLRGMVGEALINILAATKRTNGAGTPTPSHANGAAPRTFFLNEQHELAPRKSEPKRQQGSKTATVAGNGNKLGAGERAVMTAVAQHHGGVTREQVSILTGYKRSTRDAYLQRLGAAGYVEPGDGLVVATPDGVAALGADFEPLPTGSALRDHWMERLPEGERKVFKVVVDAYPRVVSREAIGESTGYKRSTRDAYLQRLGTRRLVLAGRHGASAAEELFS